jgi:GH25 family lysozyme M1 (1,4-beta-N-acetylmuramidase)
MRPAPSNRNVPQFEWDRATEEHAQYLIGYHRLRFAGLTDAEADAYIDHHNELRSLLPLLEPSEEDFAHDDHQRQVGRAAELIAKLDALIKKTL